MVTCRWRGCHWLLLVVAWFSSVHPEEIVTATPAGTVHEVVLVPEGTFFMGDKIGEGFSQAMGEHHVFLDAYYIDRYEVTTAQFVAFLNKVGATLDPKGNVWTDLNDPEVRISDARNDPLWDNTGDRFTLKSPQWADYPIFEVSWYGAEAYCTWAGLRLPSEAEWEKAARGTDGRRYPWGNVFSRGNVKVQSEGPTPSSNGTDPVGSYPGGASPYGVLDMAGNVNEWVADWFGFKPLYQDGETNPKGPITGTRRTARGGNWNISIGNIDHVTTWYREGAEPERTYLDLGFRCAWDETVRPPTTSVTNRGWGGVKGSLGDP